MNPAILRKRASIERCIQQAHEFYEGADAATFAEDYLRQDAIAMNVLRACQQTIDLANSVIAQKKLGLPASSRESFELIHRAGHISRDLCDRLGNMVAFRNRLVHDYQQVDFRHLVSAVESHLTDLLEFSDRVLDAMDEDA